MPGKLCIKCQSRPKIKGQSYCRQCYNAYVREYRRRKQGKPAEDRQSVQRPAVDIPDTVQVRIVGDGDEWAVAVRQGQRWGRVFRSDDREEALLVLGGVLGRDIR